MKHFKHYLLAIFICTIGQTSLAQTESAHNAPTLQLGLNGLSFNKGDLDAQLIMEIIAEKQSEIKVKFVQNMFLENVQDSGGTVYNYATNILKVVTEEPNAETRTRLALENTVNLVFAYAFADYIAGKGGDVDDLLSLYNLKYDKNIKVLSNIKKLNYISKDQVTDDDNKKDSLTALLIDMSSVVIRNNQRLKELGLMQVSYSSSYDYLNKYRNLKVDTDEYKKARRVYEIMEIELDSFIQIIGLASYFTNEYSFNNELKLKGNNKNLAKISNTVPGYDFKSLRTSVDAAVTVLTTKWSKENDAIISEAVEELRSSRDLITKIERLQQLNSDNTGIKSDIIFIFKNQIIPNLTKYVKYHPDLNNQLNNLNNEIILNAETLLKEDNEILEKLSSDQNKNIIRLLSTLYKFNESKTYLDYLNILADFDNVFTDKKVNTALSILNTYVKNNVSIKTSETGKEYLEFNIESFLVNLSKTSENKIRRWQFHFTVGANNIYFMNPLELPDGSLINNYSFVSEKIGVKFKIKNWGGWKSKNFGEEYKGLFNNYYTKTTPPKEPLISNWHVLAYGSGILYNLTPTGTSKEFNYPILGIGTGLTFFNALDLNITIGIPVNDNLKFSHNFSLDRSYVGIGFDIQFIEYFNRLSEKRKNNQIQKRLTN